MLLILVMYTWSQISAPACRYPGLLLLITYSTFSPAGGYLFSIKDLLKNFDRFKAGGLSSNSRLAIIWPVIRSYDSRGYSRGVATPAYSVYILIRLSSSAWLYQWPVKILNTKMLEYCITCTINVLLTSLVQVLSNHWTSQAAVRT